MIQMEKLYYADIQLMSKKGLIEKIKRGVLPLNVRYDR